MKLGAMNSPGEEVTAELSFIARNGFEFLELAVEAPEATPERLVEKEQELMEIIESYELEVVAHLPWYFEIAHPYTRVRNAFLEEVRSALDIAAAFGAELAGLHIHGLPRFFRERQMELHISALGKALGFAEEVGIRLCIENSDLRSFSTESTAEILDALPELGLVLDLGHAHIGAEGEEVLNFMHTFKEQILHVHAHDNNLKDDLHLPIGAGEIDWERVLGKLKSFYDGRVTLEVHSHDKDYLLISRKKFLKLWTGVKGF